jgi:hypothetical protein
VLTLVGENCRWHETTTSLFGFPTGRSTNWSLYRELYHVKVQCLLLFFKSTSCAARQEWSWTRKLAAIRCYYKMWRRWTINSVAEPENRLYFIDDRKHCCWCSWLKWRRGDATSLFMASTGRALRRRVNYVFLCVRRGLTVFAQKTLQTFPFHSLLNTCSSRFVSLATSPLLSSTSFWQWASLRSLSSLFIFFHSPVQ